LSKYIKAVAEG